MNARDEFKQQIINAFNSSDLEPNEEFVLIREAIKEIIEKDPTIAKAIAPPVAPSSVIPQGQHKIPRTKHTRGFCKLHCPFLPHFMN